MKRIVSAYALSILLPAVAFVVVAMRITGQYRWHTAGILYWLGWLCLLLAVRKHRRSRQIAEQGGKLLGLGFRARFRFIAVAALLLALLYFAKVLFTVEETEFLTSDVPLIESRVKADFAVMPVYLKGLSDAIGEMEKHPGLFARGAVAMSAEDRTLLRGLPAGSCSPKTI